MKASPCTLTTPKKAALYIRVSHEEQAMKGYSLKAQENRLIAYAAAKGYDIVGIYRDEGLSARHRPHKRREFTRMMQDVSDGRIEIILFVKLDRWFRNVSDYYTWQAFLDSYNVIWETTEEEYNTATAQGRLYLNIKLSIAQNESDTTAERIRFVFADKKKRREAVSGKLPLGYTICDKHIVPDEYAPVINDLFHYYLRVKSIRATMQYLYKRYHIKRSYPAVVKLLRNTKYIGYAYDDPQYLPPLISLPLFTAVQQLLSKQRRIRPAEDGRYLFTGLLVCPHCGRRLVGLTRRYKDIRYIYYHCPAADTTPSANHKFRIKETDVETALLGAVPRLMTAMQQPPAAFGCYPDGHRLYPSWPREERRHYWQTLLKQVRFTSAAEPIIDLNTARLTAKPALTARNWIRR